MRRRMQIGLRLCLAAALVFVAGCGKDKAVTPLVPVSGRVLMDNAPLPDADVTFTPIVDGKPSTPLCRAKTDRDGNFTLKADDGREGGVAGENRVEVALIDRERKGGINALKDNKSSKSTQTVPPEGTKEAHIRLTSK